MMNEEKILSDHLGKDNHFKVPEGYFDHLMEQVMDCLPEQEAQVISIQHSTAAWWKRPAMRKIAAAVAVVAMVGGGAFVALQHQPSCHPASMAQAEQVQAKQMGSEDATFDEMANYTMMDNETIYASLIAEN